MIRDNRDHDRQGSVSAASEELMSVQLSRPHPRSVTIRVSGEVDMCTAPRLEHIVLSRLSGPLDDVVVDLSEVTFLGVAGLNCLLRAGRLADECGTSLRVEAGESHAVHRVLTLLRNVLPEGLSARTRTPSTSEVIQWPGVRAAGPR